MGLLGTLFGFGGDSIAGLRKAVAQKRFVDARLIAEQLSGRPLSESDATELEQCRIAAGDGLARLNLDEALGMQRCGKSGPALEHLQLAAEQVCSAELREQIEAALTAETVPEIVPSKTARSASCDTCRPEKVPLLNDEDWMIGDAESQMDLILTSYPSDLYERYRSKGATFRDAFVLSHAGQDEQALPVWQQVSVSEQDDLYWFEVGSLWARSGRLKEAESALERALEQNPNMVLAVEALVPVLLSSGEYNSAEQRLKAVLDRGMDPLFCHAQLTSLYAQQGKFDAAEKQVRSALAAGTPDPRFLVLAASVMEHNGQLEDAENILKKLPVAGCGGGISLPLAEFWLRQKRELGRILDTFNAACREDPDNPHWQFRVAQTYLARNWRKDGLKLMQKVVNDPRLEPALVQEAERLIAEQNG